MRTLKFLSLILIVLFVGQKSFAQEAKEAVIKIKTSSQCDMCKETIEKALAYEKGVISADLDVSTKYVTVKYKTKKTNPDKIRIAITKVGYDADDKLADAVAYNELHPCCKKPEDPNSTKH